jgi:hypothetical protein
MRYCSWLFNFSSNPNVRFGLQWVLIRTNPWSEIRFLNDKVFSVNSNPCLQSTEQEH